MNRDALLATLIGFAIGLAITGVIILGPNIAKFLPSIRVPTFSLPQAKPSPTPTPLPTQFGLVIDSPLAESLESKDSLLVSGTSSPGATVVVGGLVDEDVVSVKDDGKYAGKVTLVEGKNDIVVTSYLKEKHMSQTVTVFYTPEEF